MIEPLEQRIRARTRDTDTRFQPGPFQTRAFAKLATYGSQALAERFLVRVGLAGARKGRLVLGIGMARLDDGSKVLLELAEWSMESLLQRQLFSSVYKQHFSVPIVDLGAAVG